MTQVIRTSKLRHQLYNGALTILLVALMIAAGEIAIRISGFVLTFPMPVSQ